MSLSKNAIGNLIAKYSAVLKKCHLLNVVGGMALSGMLVMGGAAVEQAEATDIASWSDLTSFLGGTESAGTLTASVTQGSSDSSITVSNSNSPSVDLAGYSITGSSSEQGIIVSSEKTLTITSTAASTISNFIHSSKSEITQGGAFNNAGTLTITGSSADAPITISGNTAGTMYNPDTSQGGAIYNSGTMYLTNATLSSNNVLILLNVLGSSTAQGGAICNTGTMSLENTSFSSNYVMTLASASATAQGGAIYNSGTLNFSGENTVAAGTSTMANDVYNAGTINVTGGTTTIKSTYTQGESSAQLIVDAGTFANAGTVAITAGTVTVNASGTLTTSDTLTVGGGSNTATFYNAGTVNVTAGECTIESNGIFSNSGTLNLTGGTFTVEENGTITNTGTVNVNGGELVIEGTGNISVGNVNFGAGSKVTLDGNAMSNNTPVFKMTLPGSKIQFGNNAQIHIVNAKVSTPPLVQVTGNTGSLELVGTTTVSTDVDMLSGKLNPNGKLMIVVNQSAANVYPKLDGELARLVDGMYASGVNYVNSTIPGVKFLSRATNNRILGTTDTAAATKTMESASRIAMAGAVPQMSIMASDSLTEAIGNRMNIANGNSAIQEQQAGHNITLWITPLWKNQSGFGMEANKLDYGFNGNIGGLAIGGDYSFSEKVKAGIAFNLGGGYAESAGDFSKTTNNMKFGGVGLYGGYNDGTMSLMADVSYTSTYNNVKQDLDSRMGMQDLSADIQASVLTAGIRGDYKFALDCLDITPHVGVRFTSVSSQDYKIESSGTVAKSDGFQQTFWSIPVGFSFGKEFTTDGGWTLTPSVDVTVTPRFGDLKASESIRYTGVSGEADLHTQTRDYVTYKGTAGISAKYKNIGLTLNYSYEAGSCTNSHGVNASFKWEF